MSCTIASPLAVLDVLHHCTTFGGSGCPAPLHHLWRFWIWWTAPPLAVLDLMSCTTFGGSGCPAPLHHLWRLPDLMSCTPFGILPTNAPHRARVGARSVAAVSRLFERHRVWVSKVKHLFFSKLVAAVGTGKKYRRRQIIENKHLFCPFQGV